jgi:hypothetical protein
MEKWFDGKAGRRYLSDGYDVESTINCMRQVGR